MANWASIVDEEVKRSGFQGHQIAERSNQVVEEFCSLDSALIGHELSPANLSRMAAGKLKRPRREKLIVLHLTLQCLRGTFRAAVEREEALASAVRFAEKVAAAVASGAGSDASRSGSHDPYDPRHHRTVDLFGVYGQELLRQTQRKEEGGKPWVKLATLHYLSGNADDARYWRIRVPAPVAGDPADSMAQVNAEAAARTAFRFGRQYLSVGRLDAAIIYLRVAAEAGHMDAAYQLGDLCELRDDQREAIRWFRKAEELGHMDGKRRAGQFDTTSTEPCLRNVND